MPLSGSWQKCNKEAYPTRVIPARRLSWRAGALTPETYLVPEAFSVPMGSRRWDGVMSARRMAEPIMFIMSQVASVHLADMDLRDHQLRYNVRLFGN